MLESKIEKESAKEAAKHGWISYKFLSQLHKGLPDKVYLGHGKVVFIEYKQPGKKPTKLQAKVHQDFLKQGIKVYIATSVNETMDILNNSVL